MCGGVQLVDARPTDSMKECIQKRYKKGPFAWANIMEHMYPNIHMCSNCVNHVRKRKKSKTKIMLPMDQFLVGCMEPYYIATMDNRTKKRIMSTLRNPGNMYLKINNAPIASCLAANLRGESWLSQWWSNNLHSKYFSESSAARFIRMYVSSHDCADRPRA